MNLKHILKIYTLERQLNPDDIALLNTLRSLNDTERELLVESLGPQGKGKKTTTITRVYERCARCDKTKGHSFHKDSTSDGYHEFQAPAKQVTKSPRASSLQQQIQATTNKPHLGDGPICQVCSHTEDYEDHQQPSPHYHEFQSPQQKAASGD